MTKTIFFDNTANLKGGAGYFTIGNILSLV